MFDLEGCLRDQLRGVMTTKQTLIFPEGDEPRVLAAASKLVQFANILLVCSRAKAKRTIAEHSVRLECSEKRFFALVRFVEPASEAIVAELGSRLFELGRGKKWSMSSEEAAAKVREPVTFAIMAVRQGYADAVLGGLTHSSRSFFLPCLRLLEKEGTVYEMALFALPDEHRQGIYGHNLVMFADVALNPVPTAEALADIAVGAARTMRDIIPVKTLPEINTALLSYSTRGSGQGPSVERVRAADPLIAERLTRLRQDDRIYESLNIITEMQISVALSETAAKTKLGEAYESLRGAGKANVLIVPTLDVGNLLYHIYATRYPAAKSILIIGGLHNQALDFSRSSTVDEIARGAKALLLRRFKSKRYARTPNDYFFPRYRILTINPGSTSTKVALFEGEDEVARDTARHDAEQLAKVETLLEQLPLRREVVERFLMQQQLSVPDLHAVVGRGGLLLPVESGTYAVDDRVAEDLARGVSGEHPSNLGGLIARELAQVTGIPAYIVDPPVVDELDETSRITGYQDSEQEAAWHALSQKAAAKLFAEQFNKEYENLNLIVAHLGGGISVGAHRNGRCVKVRNALYDGPMTPNRAGSIPGYDLINLCYSGIPREELQRRLVKQGGLLSYLNTDDLRVVEARIAAGEQRAKVVYEAMIEQIAAEIASCIPKFGGEPVDQILCTGGLCHSQNLRTRLLALLAPLHIGVTVYPGEREMEALRDGALRVLRGVEVVKPYKPLRAQL